MLSIFQSTTGEMQFTEMYDYQNPGYGGQSSNEWLWFPFVNEDSPV